MTRTRRRGVLPSGAARHVTSDALRHYSTPPLFIARSTEHAHTTVRSTFPLRINQGLGTEGDPRPLADFFFLTLAMIRELIVRGTGDSRLQYM